MDIQFETDNNQITVRLETEPGYTPCRIMFRNAPTARGIWEIKYIETTPIQQGKGLARVLINKLEQAAYTAGVRFIFADVPESDNILCKLFKDYEPVAYIDDFYAVGKGRITYRKPICG